MTTWAYYGRLTKLWYACDARTAAEAAGECVAVRLMDFDELLSTERGRPGGGG